MGFGQACRSPLSSLINAAVKARVVFPAKGAGNLHPWGLDRAGDAAMRGDGRRGSRRHGWAPAQTDQDVWPDAPLLAGKTGKGHARARTT
jgi:hypothetical protein